MSLTFIFLGAVDVAAKTWHADSFRGTGEAGRWKKNLFGDQALTGIVFLTFGQASSLCGSEIAVNKSSAEIIKCSPKAANITSTSSLK